MQPGIVGYNVVVVIIVVEDEGAVVVGGRGLGQSLIGERRGGPVDVGVDGGAIQLKTQAGGRAAFVGTRTIAKAFDDDLF